MVPNHQLYGKNGVVLPQSMVLLARKFPEGLFGAPSAQLGSLPIRRCTENHPLPGNVPALVSQPGNMVSHVGLMWDL